MYASVEDIRAASRNLDAIMSAPRSEIEAWGLEAKTIIDRFCGQDFNFEVHSTRIVRADGYILNFDKPISGDVSLISQTGTDITGPDVTERADGTRTLIFGDYFMYPGESYFLYKPSNRNFYPPSNPRNWAPDNLEITGDWGWAVSEADLVIRLANEIKDKYQSHRSSGVFHQAIDVVNVVSSPDADDLDSAITLLNELKVDISNHFLDLGFHCAVEEEAIDSGIATNLQTAMTLAEDVKHDFNLHIVNEPAHQCMELDHENHVYGSTSNPIMPPTIKIVFTRLVKRLAIRSNLDDTLQLNSPYVSELTGDGYTYNLNNGTLRNLLRPEDRELLWPYVSHGRIII